MSQTSQMSQTSRLHLRVFRVAILVMALGPGMASACEVCYGAADSPWIDASRAAVGLLLAVTVVVLASFATFFVYLRNRARAHLLVEEEGSA